MTFEDEVIDLLKDIRSELQGGSASSGGNTGGGNPPSGNGGSGSSSNRKKSKLSKEDIIYEITKILNKGLSTYKEYQLSDIQKQIINTEAIYKQANITLESNLKILTNNIKLGGDTLVSAFKSSYASLTNGIDAAVSAATDSVLSLIVEKGKVERENYLKQLQRDNKIELTERERQVKYQAESNKQTMALVDFGTSLVNGASNLLPPIWKTVTQAATSITQNIISTNLAISQAKSEAELRRLQQDKEFYEKQQEAFNQIINQQFEFAQNIAKVGQDLTNGVKKYVKDGNKLFNKTAIELGLNGNNIEQFIKGQFEQGSRMVLNKATNTFLNWSNEQRAKFQQGYSEKTGFAISLTENDQFKAGMMSQLWGEDTVNEISSAMQLYNHSVSDSVDMMNEMYNLSRQNGLSQSKFSKELAKNLKLAEKHQFKGGVKGLMEMTAWEQKMRFNMDEFGSVLNKIKDGGLEGVIEQAANLQVLGGNFAMGSDPLAMLWETYNDPQALGKRLHGMVRGMGTYNDKTGEVDFNMQDQLMLQSMAKATGQSVESLMNMSRQNVKRKYLENAITNGNYSDAQKELIYAKATKDEKGNWQVNGKDINRLEASDFAELEGTDQGILENVKNISSMVERMAGADIFNKNRVASDNYDEIKKQNDNIIQEEIRFYDNLDPIKKVITSELEFEVNSLKQMHDITNKYADVLPNALALLEKQRQDTFNALDGDIKKFREYVHYLIIGDVEGLKQHMAKYDGVNTNQNADGSTRIPIEDGIKEALYNYRGNKSNIVSHKKELDDFFQNYKTGTALTPEQIDTLDDILSNGLGGNDMYNNMESAGVKNKQDLSSTEVVDAIYKYYKYLGEHTNYTPLIMGSSNTGYVQTKDSLLSSNGSSMLTAASNVTPIHDGSVQLAKSDPKDSAIFAKTGGPFDTLFNGIFAKINEVSEILPKSMSYNMPIDIRKSLSESLSHSKDTTNNPNIQINPIKIELNGKLELTNSNGQSVDIINTIKNNPMLLRQLSELISQSINENIYGGKSTFNAGVTTSRFKPL